MFVADIVGGAGFLFVIRRSRQKQSVGTDWRELYQSVWPSETQSGERNGIVVGRRVEALS
jgi:hypothetical protein